MLKILPKMLSGVFRNSTHYALSVFLLCLHYAPNLAAFVTIIMEHFNQQMFYWSIYYKVTVPLESINLRSYDQCI